MITKWEVTGELLHDASNRQTVIVDANGKEKAKAIGKKKIQTKFNVSYVNIVSCKKIVDDWLKKSRDHN